MPSYDPNRITQLEERLAVTPAGVEPQLSELEMLADRHAGQHITDRGACLYGYPYLQRAPMSCAQDS